MDHAVVEPSYSSPDQPHSSLREFDLAESVASPVAFPAYQMACLAWVPVDHQGMAVEVHGILVEVLPVDQDEEVVHPFVPAVLVVFVAVEREGLAVLV